MGGHQAIDGLVSSPTPQPPLESKEISNLSSPGKSELTSLLGKILV